MLDSIYKIFAGILFNRLTVWVNVNGILCEFPAGFRKSYSTIDNLFYLTSLVTKFVLVYAIHCLEYGLARFRVFVPNIYTSLVKLNLANKKNSFAFFVDFIKIKLYSPVSFQHKTQTLLFIIKY